MTEHRWSKFWWADYEGDDALRVVSLAAQGLWMRMLCAMHKGTPYGHLTINGRAPTVRQIGILASVSEGKTEKLMQELEKSGVFSRTETGVIFCRRMVRDREISERGQQDGKRGGNPTLKAKPQEGLTPPLNHPPYALEAEADTETESKSPPVAPPRADAPRAASPTPRERGSRIPDGWQPEDATFAARHGVDEATALPEFRDYWRGVAGKAGVKLDWEATWRNQVRHLAAKRAQAPPRKTSQMSPEDQNADLMRRMQAAMGQNEENPVLRLVR